MTTVTISAAGAHASASSTDRIPASKAGVKGYLTPTQLATLIFASPTFTGTIGGTPTISGQWLFNARPTFDIPTGNYTIVKDSAATSGQTGYQIQVANSGGTTRNHYLYAIGDTVNLLADTGCTINLSPGAGGTVSVGSAMGLTGAITALNATAIPAGGTAGSGIKMSSTSNFGVFFGSGAPSLSAAKGSLYLRSDGSTVNDRMYVNTNGSTTWTAVTTVG